MKLGSARKRRQQTVVLGMLLLLELVLVLIQLWLFVSTLEGALSGRPQMAIPAAIASVACLAINCWMLVGLYRLDRGR